MINLLIAVNGEQEEVFNTHCGIGTGVIVGAAISARAKVPNNLVAVCDECKVA